MDIHLLSLAEWAALLRHPDERERRRGEFLLGTIVDVLQIAEGCKKADLASIAAFRAGWQALGEVPAGLMPDGTVQCCGLDRDSLLAALFDEDRGLGNEGCTLWAPASDRTTRPWRTLRRLILRATDQRYWDDDVYHAMEGMFGEELGRDE